MPKGVDNSHTYFAIIKRDKAMNLSIIGKNTFMQLPTTRYIDDKVGVGDNSHTHISIAGSLRFEISAQRVRDRPFLEKILFCEHHQDLYMPHNIVVRTVAYPL